jgi:hypothetical protein
MKNKSFLIAVCLLLFSFTKAQEGTSKFSYANIAEAGLVNASPQGYGLEITTVNGFSINKHHVVGFGVGIGTNYHNSHNFYHYGWTRYMPVFVNYRYYFFPDRKFSPHVSASLGGTVSNSGNYWGNDYGGGIYSSITAGFRVKKFSLSSGISFMPMAARGYMNYGCEIERSSEWEMYFPWGFMVKLGFAF